MELSNAGKRQLYLIGVDYFHKFCYLSNSKINKTMLVEKKEDLKIVARSYDRCLISAKSFMQGFTYENPIFLESWSDEGFYNNSPIRLDTYAINMSEKLKFSK